MDAGIDEETLVRIADLTGGKYYRATDRTHLENIYQSIDALEKTRIEVEEYTRYSELFIYFTAAAGLLLLAEVILAQTRFRKIP